MHRERHRLVAPDLQPCDVLTTCHVLLVATHHTAAATVRQPMWPEIYSMSVSSMTFWRLTINPQSRVGWIKPVAPFDKHISKNQSVIVWAVPAGGHLPMPRCG